MRIAFQTLFVVLVCVFGGLFSSLLIGTNYQLLQNLQERHSNNLLNLREVEHQQTMLSQWFVTIDLFFNQHQSYLVNGIKVQAGQLTDMLEAVLIQRKKNNDQPTGQLGDSILSLQKNIHSLSEIITAAAILPEASGQDWSQALNRADRSSETVIVLLEEILNQYLQLSQESENRLVQHKQWLPWVIGLTLFVYILIVLWVWSWASKSTIQPLESLSEEANQAIDKEDHQQDFQLNKGPREVRQLGMRLQNFSSQLHEKIIQANAATQKIEQQKIQLQENLDQLAKTRLQLIHAEKMASIGQLGAGVAHEINNPIGFVKGNLESLDEYKNNVINVLQGYKQLETHIANGADDQLKKMLENIEQIKEEQDLDFVLIDMGELITESLDGAGRIQKIVKDLKSFSRVDDLGVQDVDLNEDVIETALRLVWSEMKGKCTLDKSLASLPLYSCHAGELSQVILNLLVNASDAIEKDGIIGVHSEFIDNAIQIKISDNGTGINEQDLLKLFDPFFSTKDIGKGTGLGLSTAQGIVDKHGGSLEVESELGVGTTFIIKLPMAEQVATSLGDNSEKTANTA